MLTYAGYIIPSSVVQHFLKDVLRHGLYTGFVTLGITWAPLENTHLRAYVGIDVCEVSLSLSRSLARSLALSLSRALSLARSLARSLALFLDSRSLSLPTTTSGSVKALLWL